MKQVINDRTSTGTDALLAGFNGDNFSSEDVLSINLTQTRCGIEQRLIKRGTNISVLRSRAVHSNFELDFITESNTGLICTVVSSFTGSLKPSESNKHEIASISIKTDECFTKTEDHLNLNAIANNFLFKIENLENQGKKHESIKESHRLFENLLSFQTFEIADQILKQAANRKFSLAILIAFLASTIPFKNELINRRLLFDKAKKLAIAELGEHRVNHSIFNNLK